MDFPSIIDLPFIRENSVSPQDSEDDKYPESFPRYFIEHYTKAGDKVLDPFMGHGTTAFVAEALGRIPYGIEADMERYEWAAGQIEHWGNMRCADAADCASLSLPKMDFCITSPPFMMKNHRWNPLYGGDKAYNGYSCYLERLNEIFCALKSVMKKGALLVVHADNLSGAVYTPLVRDFSIIIGENFNPVGETIIQWRECASECSRVSHALIFKNF